MDESETDIAGILQSHPLFASFGLDALAEAVRAASVIECQPGDLCIQRRDAGMIFGLLVSGRLEAVRGHGTLQREHMGFIEEGECFGEMSLLTGNPTSADVVSVVRSRAIVFMQQAIAPLVALNREAVQYLTRLMSKRLTPAEREPGVDETVATVRYSLGAIFPMRILSVSCRKDDVRYSYFDTTSERAIARGIVSGMDGSPPSHVYEGPAGRREGPKAQTHEGAIDAALAMLTQGEGGVIGSLDDLSAIGHRVIHGGTRFTSPTVIDEEVRDEVRRLAHLAPLDNPYNLRGVEKCMELVPGIPHVAVFDTTFHRTMPEAATLYALPGDLAHDPELRRFGFHGISHEGAARDACEHLAVRTDAVKMITCHLGRGASATAIDHGRSVDNTMGFTSIEGMIMATRSGSIDPGLILHLVSDHDIPADVLSERLFTEVGLAGLSGVSGDILAVTEAANQGHAHALVALQAYCMSARKHLAAYVGLLGGVEVIVFTGGVGENAPGVRARICQGLEWMGIRLDETCNRSTQVGPGEVVEISESRSRAHVLVVGSDEEHTVARQTVRALAADRVTDVIHVKHRKIPISISAHHIHLTQEHVEELFGAGHVLTPIGDLSQPGQFACKEQVNLLGPRGRIDRVRVLGPARPES